MIFLQVIWIAAAVLIVLSLFLWVALLAAHIVAKRHDLRAAGFSEVWLERLLDVLDGTQPPEVLPVPASREEAEAVISLLRSIGERFRGSYGERMSLVLEQIRAADLGLQLLRSRSSNNKVRGCALLGWCGPHPAVQPALENALNHRDSRVVLEAASALVNRGTVSDIVLIVLALCRSRAAKSLLARDLFRRWGETDQGNWSALLERDWTEDGWILLLEAAGASARGEWTPLIARQAKHPSPLVVQAALAALGVLGDPQGAPAAEQACRHERPQVRSQAIKTLGACGESNLALPLMEFLLADESFEVRRAALQGMLQFGGRSRLMEMAPTDYWQHELFKEAGLQAPPEA